MAHLKCYKKNGGLVINIGIIKQFYPLLLQGISVTFQIAFYSCLIGSALGTIVGIIFAGKNRFLKAIARVYVTIIRGTPMLVQIAATFNLLRAAGVQIPAFWSAIISIGLNSGAYISQIIFSGIKSIGKGQVEAAQTLGLTKNQTTKLIILPQAIRTMLPTIGNEFITLMKDSCLASTIGVYELTQQSKIIMSQTYDIPTMYLALGLIYLALTSIISVGVSLLEKKLRIPC